MNTDEYGISGKPDKSGMNINRKAKDGDNSSDRRKAVLNVQFNPSEYGILNQYKEV